MAQAHEPLGLLSSLSLNLIQIFAQLRGTGGSKGKKKEFLAQRKKISIFYIITYFPSHGQQQQPCEEKSRQKKALHAHSMSGSQAQEKDPEKENDLSFFQEGIAV